MKIMVSACLLGDNVKYNGKNNKNEDLIRFLVGYDIIKVCPEVMGGLSIPRIPSEIRENKVINRECVDVTNYFNDGAHKVLEIAKKEKIQIAILKERSPSCGSNYIYDGTFNNKVIEGMGITTRLLRENGIIVLNEDNYLEYLKGLNNDEKERRIND